LVRHLSAKRRAIIFSIEVAAYPEVHPQAKSPTADLEAFATQGAWQAPTQPSPSTSSTRTRTFAFAMRWRAHGASNIPIIPGIMPDYQRHATDALLGRPAARKFRAGSGMRLLSYGDDLASIRAFGLDVVADTVRPPAGRSVCPRCTSTP